MKTLEALAIKARAMLSKQQKVIEVLLLAAGFAVIMVMVVRLEKRRLWMPAAGGLAVSACLIIYLVLYLKVGGTRIVHSSLFFLSTATLVTASGQGQWRTPSMKTGSGRHGRVLAGAIAAAALFCVNFSWCVGRSIANGRNLSYFKEIIQELDRSPDGRFVHWTSTIPVEFNSIYDMRSYEAMRNMIWSGTWLTGSPLYEKQLSRLGMTGVHDDLVDSDDLFLILRQRDPGKIKMLATFMKEHRGKSVDVVKTPLFEKHIAAYRVITAPGD